MMRHKVGEVDYGTAYIPDKGMYSVSSLQLVPTEQIDAPGQTNGTVDSRTRPVGAAQDDQKPLSLGLRFTIIVGLSLVLWAVLIGMAMAVLA